MLYTSWSLGTLAGALLMNVVSSKFADALGIAIYAAFISMLMPSLKASRKILLTVVFTALVNVLLSTIMGNGLNIIISMLRIFATALPDEGCSMNIYLLIFFMMLVTYIPRAFPALQSKKAQHLWERFLAIFHILRLQPLYSQCSGIDLQRHSRTYRE